MGTNALFGTPPWEMAGAIGAALATWGTGDISRACEDRALIESTSWSMDPPPESFRWDFAERESLLAGGGATLYYDGSGSPRLQTSRTTYRETPGGAADTSYEQHRILEILSRFGSTQRSRVQTQFQAGGAAPATTRVLRAIKAACCAIYRQECDAERMDPDSFAAYASSILVAKNGTYPNRVDITDQPQPTGTASVITIRNQFKLL